MGADRLMANRITDPNLIKKLNSLAGFEEDSKTLENSSPKNESSQNILSSLARVPLNLAIGAGGGIQNLGHDILPSLIRKFEPQGLSQSIAEPIANAAAFIAGPEAAIAKGASYLGKSIPFIEKLTGEGLSALSKRLASNTAFGAITEPEDRLKGAEKGLVTGAIGESIPSIAKGLGRTAEFLYPQNYTNELATAIRNNYLKSKEEASQFYQPVINQLGESKITHYPNYSQYRKLGKETFDVYPTKLKEVHDEFISSPNFKNAHTLQSRLGKTLSTYVSKNESQNDIEKLSKAKELLQNDIHRFLQSKRANLSQQYKDAAKFYKESVVPFRGEKTITDISSGKVKTLKPQKLKESLRKLSEQEGVLPEKHYLNQSLTELTNKINRGKAFSTAGSLGAGFAIPGGGLLAGAVGNAYLTPKLLELATNPTINRNIPKVMPYYDALVKSIINAQTGNR